VHGVLKTQVAIEHEDVDSFDLLALFLPVVVVPILYEVSSHIEDKLLDFDSLIFGTQVCFLEDGGLFPCSN